MSKTIVAWSGGRDSTVLLHHLLETSNDVVAVHVDHKMRESSANDRQFCVETARDLGVALEVVTLDVQQHKSKQGSARTQRLAALERVAYKLGAHEIVTGHHGDDAAETALMNFQRGTGIRGLTMQTETQRNGFVFRKPILSWSSDEVQYYAERNDLTWIEDPSNATKAYTRNAVRHDVMPLLDATGMHRSVAQLRVDAIWMSSRVDTLFNDAKLPHSDRLGLRFNRRVLDGYVLMRALTTLGVSVGSELIEHILMCDLGRRTFKNLVVDTQQDDVVLTRSFGRGARYQTKREFARAVEISSESSTPWFSFRIVSGNDGIEVPVGARVRGWRHGDFFDGRKVTDHLRAIGVPLSDRWWYPMFEFENKIVAIPGLDGPVGATITIKLVPN